MNQNSKYTAYAAAVSDRLEKCATALAQGILSNPNSAYLTTQDVTKRALEIAQEIISSCEIHANKQTKNLL